MRTLWARLTLICVGVLVVSLASASALAYQLLFNSGRDNLDTSLRRESARLQTIVTATADRRTGQDRTETIASDAVREYLLQFPDTDSYLTVSRIGQEVLTAPNRGPAELENLLVKGNLPVGPTNHLWTARTNTGKVRTLVAPISVRGEIVGTFQVAGPLDPVTRAAQAALRRLVAAAIASLLLGAALIATVLRTGLRPLRALSSAARATDIDDFTAHVPQLRRDDELGALAQDFNRMLERLDSAAKARQELLAMISHELRTPITICLGHIEILQRIGAADPARVVDATSVVREELVTMRIMVEDLMALARSETGDFLNRRPVALAEFLDDLRLRFAGLQLDGVVVERALDVMVHIDPDRVGQAVLNLVVNARSHTPLGTAISVRTAVNEGALEIVVTDDGQGIDPAILDHAFDPFVRGSDAARGGHGLGLAVVRAVAAAHGGRVVVETGGTGTVISLHLSGETDAGHRFEFGRRGVVHDPAVDAEVQHAPRR